MEKGFDYIKETLEQLESTDLLDFFHMDKYTYTQDENGYLIKYVIPGANKDDISIKVTGEILSINVLKGELFSGLKDAMGVPDGVEADSITSKYIDGILLITLPSKEKTESETVEVAVE